MNNLEKPLTANIRPGKPPFSLKEYEQAGGYQAVRKALHSLTPAEVTDMVKASNLRGRGGAGFPTGQKWSFVPVGADAIRPKYLVVNADEMEPAAFKDRMLLEGNPHQLIEGIIVAGYAIQADIAYIFLRREYTLPAKRLKTAIAEAYAGHYLGQNILESDFSLQLYLRRGNRPAELLGGPAGRPPCQTALSSGGRALGQIHHTQ
jgi:NADH-quinone oxidoreductase subunit F